jgi:hypothetical protein
MRVNFGEHRGKRRSQSFLLSRANLTWCCLAFAIAASQVIIHRRIPAFTPPASPDKPSWVRAGLYGEMIFNVAVLGALITSIRNRIPWWKQPSYSDEGTLTIESAETSTQPEAKWAEIGWIVLEFVIYLALWSWIYRII